LVHESHPPLLRACRAFDRRIQQVEVWVCLLALAVMVFLAFAQVILRQVAGGAIPFAQPVAWFDNIARHMVIWVGVLGASLATAEGRHISIEAVPKLLGPAARRRVDVLVNLAAAAACGVLLVLSVIYLQRVQLPNEAHLFIIEALDWKIYRWPFLVVVPIGLALMTWRFGLRIAEAVSLDDDTYAELRAEENEVEELDEKELAVGDEGEVADAEVVDLGGPAPDAEAQAPAAGDSAAMAEARRALSSDHWDERSDPAAEPPAPTPASSDLADVDDLGDESEEGSPLGPDSEESESLPAHIPSLRSTDEIPIYTDISDTEDLREPEVRASERVVDSSDELEAVYGMEDLVGDPLAETGSAAEDAIEAMARSTDRMAPPDPADSAPLGLGEVATDRLAQPELPSEEPAEDEPKTEGGDQ
jgi:TRAP-type C4-dicarboxylate transport system permease small subunit